MKAIMLAIAVIMSTATITVADSLQYQFTPSNDKSVCTNTDIAIGAGAGILGGAVLGVASIIGAPVIGAAAGTTMTWGMAMSAPFLTNATASLAVAGATIIGPFVGIAGYYISCVTREVF